MGNKQIFCPKSVSESLTGNKRYKASVYFGNQISQIFTNWEDCKNFIIKSFQHYKAISISDTTLSKRLETYGNAEYYCNNKLIRGEIMLAKQIRVDVSIDCPDINFKFYIKSETVNIDASTDEIKSVLIDLMASAEKINPFSEEVAQAVTAIVENNIEELFEKGTISKITQEPPVYVKINLEYEF
jgi:hypothetical protein